MKTTFSVLAAVAVLALGVTPAAGAKTTYIGCAVNGTKVKPFQAPKTCNTWFPWLSHAQSTGC